MATDAAKRKRKQFSRKVFALASGYPRTREQENRLLDIHVNISESRKNFPAKNVKSGYEKKRKSYNPMACTLLNSYYSDGITNIYESLFRFDKDLLRV